MASGSLISQLQHEHLKFRRQASEETQFLMDETDPLEPEQSQLPQRPERVCHGRLVFSGPESRILVTPHKVLEEETTVLG